MQSKDAALQRMLWKDKPCDHPKFEKEYYLGSQTGDYNCSTCGAEFSESQVKKILKEREDKAKKK